MSSDEIIENHPRMIVLNPLYEPAIRRMWLAHRWEKVLLCKRAALTFLFRKGFGSHTRAAQRAFCRWVSDKAFRLAEEGVEPDDGTQGLTVVFSANQVVPSFEFNGVYGSI